MMNTTYIVALGALVSALNTKSATHPIEYKVVTCLDGFKIEFPKINSDVMCNSYSYGGNFGRWEFYGPVEHSNEKEVLGSLTEEEVIQYVLKRMERMK